MSYPYFRSIFTLLLIKQIFEKINPQGQRPKIGRCFGLELPLEILKNWIFFEGLEFRWSVLVSCGFMKLLFFRRYTHKEMFSKEVFFRIYLANTSSSADNYIFAQIYFSDLSSNFGNAVIFKCCQKQLPRGVLLKRWGLQLYPNRESGKGVFLWILLNFEEHILL